MRSYFKSSLFFWGWLFLFFLLGSSPLEAKERVSLQLRWDHQFQFAGYYAAEMMGYYDDVDLDVDIRSAITPEFNILSATEEVASGRADFGVGAADILIRNHKGAKLKVLGTIFQHSAARLYVKNEKWPVPLATLAAQYRVARNINDLIDIEFQGMLRAEGIEPEKVKTYKHQPGLDHFVEDRVDVIPGYALTLPYVAEVAGLEIAEIKPQSFGIDFYGDSLFANETIILKDPELVDRFFTASIKGWKYAIRHPEVVVNYLQEHYSRRFKIDYSEALNRHQAKLIADLMEVDVVEPGYTHQHTWEKMHLTLKTLGLIKGDFLAESLLWVPAIEMQKTREKTWQNLVVLIISLLGVSLLILYWALYKVGRQRQELLKSENLLRETLSSIQDPVFITDDKGRFTFICPNVSHSLGYTVDELEAIGNISNLIGKNLFDAGELEKKGSLENVETVVTVSNGRPKTYLINVKCVAIDEGTRLFVMRDITNRRRVEEENKRLIDRLLLATSSAQLGVWDLNIRENTMIWDDRMFELYGVTREETPNNIDTWMNGLHPEDKEAVLAAYHAALDGENDFDVEFRIVHPDGIVKHIKANGMVIRSVDGKPDRMLGINADISDRKKIFEEYRRSAQLAAIGTIAAGVAHEINNPIQGILNYATILKNKPDQPDRTLEISTRIIKESERIAEITKELLDFARDGHKKMEFADICPLVESAIDLIEKKVIRQGISIETNCPSGLPKIQLYPQGIQQIVINLIDNASDALQDKEIPITEKIIKVSCYIAEHDGGYQMCLEVADQGIGMPPEVLEKAKETFFSTKPSFRGTGLGLSIVTDIVNRHNGNMEIESVAGEYTKVKIYFSIAENIS